MPRPTQVGMELRVRPGDPWEPREYYVLREDGRFHFEQAAGGEPALRQLVRRPVGRPSCWRERVASTRGCDIPITSFSGRACTPFASRAPLDCLRPILSIAVTVTACKHAGYTGALLAFAVPGSLPPRRFLARPCAFAFSARVSRRQISSHAARRACSSGRQFVRCRAVRGSGPTPRSGWCATRGRRGDRRTWTLRRGAGGGRGERVVEVFAAVCRRSRRTGPAPSGSARGVAGRGGRGRRPVPAGGYADPALERRPCSEHVGTTLASRRRLRQGMAVAGRPRRRRHGVRAGQAVPVVRRRGKEGQGPAARGRCPGGLRRRRLRRRRLRRRGLRCLGPHCHGRLGHQRARASASASRG